MSKAQHTDSAFQKLVRHGLIDEDGMKEANEFVEEYDIPNDPKNWIGILMLLEIQQFGEEMKKIGSVSFDFSQEFSEEEKAAAKMSLTTYTYQLDSADLLFPRLRDTLLNQVENSEIRYKIQLLSSAYFMYSYFEEMSEENLLSFSKTLLDNDILTQENYSSLTSEIKAGRIHTESGLLVYCKQAKVIDVDDYFREGQLDIEHLYRDVASLLPELSFTDFNYNIVKDPEWAGEDLIQYNSIVSLKSGGRVYKQKEFYDFIKPHEAPPKVPPAEYKKLYEVFNPDILNMILADAESPLRFHLISFPDFTQFDQPNTNRFGIIVLNEKQAKALPSPQRILNIREANYAPSLSNKNVVAMIEGWKKSGILSHLSDEVIKQTTDNVLMESYRDSSLILTYFPDVTLRIEYEMGILEKPYESFTQDLIRISHGAFSPARIIDKFDIMSRKDRFLYSFDINGKSYSRQLENDGDWLDPGFFELVKAAMEESDAEGIFYELEDADGVMYIYLTPSQYTYLKENKLLLFEEDIKLEMGDD